MLFYYKGNTSKTGDNSNKKKKNVITFFSMRNPYMKFQNISIQGSKLMLCTKWPKLQRAITPNKSSLN